MLSYLSITISLHFITILLYSIANNQFIAAIISYWISDKNKELWTIIISSFTTKIELSNLPSIEHLAHDEEKNTSKPIYEILDYQKIPQDPTI